MTDEKRTDASDGPASEPQSNAARTPRFGEMRPPPQYGEYATPQDQAKAMGLSHPPISPLTVPPRAPDAAARVNTRHRDPSRDPSQDASPGFTGLGPKRPRRWDFILTSVLLAYATWNVVSQVFISSDLSGVINQFYEAEGIGTYRSSDLSTTLGSVLNVVTILLFAATVFVTSRLLRSGRLAFYVPIVGGAIAIFIALVFVAVIVMGDPAFLAYTAGIRA